MKTPTLLHSTACAATLAIALVSGHAADNHGFCPPAVTEVVSPTGLSWTYEDTTVTLAFSVDATGHPSNIRLISPRDESLGKSLVTAVSQWVFTPAERNGVALPADVVLPLRLVDGPTENAGEQEAPAGRRSTKGTKQMG